jgi:CDP-diacylglycerol---serine O-phosphatidyltransferase
LSRKKRGRNPPQADKYLTPLQKIRRRNMDNQDSNAEKRPFLFRRGGRKRPLKYIAVLPALITLLNGTSGFLSLMFASKGAEEMIAGRSGESSFAWSAMLILVAMVADMLDGRVARMSRTTSSFGGQLDSLCDVISFGVAPAFLGAKLLASELAGLDIESPQLAIFLLRIVWLAGIVYVSCAAIRLARFNVENEEDESAHMSFMGLPSPAAAGVVASLVILYLDLPTKKGLSEAASDWGQHVIIFALPLAVAAAGILMVSRFRYPHVVNQFVRGKKKFTTLFKVLALVVLVVIIYPEAALMAAFVGFAASGPGKWAYYRFVVRRAPFDEAARPSLKGGDAAADEE